MPHIASKTKDRISEQILAHLYTKAPEPQYTSSIAQELARDEEFIKSLLLSLEKQKLVIKITKNAAGYDFVRRQRWRLSNNAFDAYKRIQSPKLTYPERDL